MIGTTTNTAEFVGNASTVTAYVIPFRYDAAAWVHVVLVDADGVATDLEQVTDYTLAGDGSASEGTFTTVESIPATSTVKVYREATGTQTIDLEPNTALPAASLEGQLDRLAMAAMDRVSNRLFNAHLPLQLATAPTVEVPSFVGQLAIVADDSVFIATSLSPVTWVQLSN